MATNNLNAIAVVSPGGMVSTLTSNGSQGSLQFPGSGAIVDTTAYVVNFGVPR